MKTRANQAWLLGVSLLLSGCSQVWPLPVGLLPVPQHTRIRSGALSETFVAQQQRILSPALESQCDTENMEEILALLKKIDLQSAAIAQFERNHDNTKNLHSVSRELLIKDKMFILNDDRISKAPSANEPFSKEMPSWKDLIEDVHDLEKIPDLQSRRLEWSRLSVAANYLLVRDQLRLEWGYNFSLKISERPTVLMLVERVDNCLANETCDPRNLLLMQASMDERAILRRHPPYAELTSLATRREFSIEERRKHLAQLKEWTNRDYEAQSFTRNTRIERSKPNRFTVELDAGPLSEHTSTLEKWLKVFWSNEAFELHFKWKKPLAGAEFFRFELVDVNAVATVNMKDKTVRIPWITTLRTLSHEFGHVLGLPDRYETLWNADTCRYTQNAWPDDLMSASWTGQVLSEHWRELDRNYPWKP